MEGTRRLVKLEDIHKSFNQSKVLKGVSLEVCESEVISIVGGNGAGKSTLMKILSGVYKADHGNIEIEGEKMVHLHPSLVHEKGIYLVPQEPLLFPNMTVAQNLCIGMKKRKAEVREKANLLMEQLDWRLELNRVALSLSIAEQQQVEIIKGLLRDAKVLILDEPTSSLTFAETQALFRIIEKLRASGAGIIYITHRLDEVFQISTHAAILRDGKVTLKGKIARGIDAAARNDIYTIITQLKEQGTSILLISSDLEEIERVSDRVYAIYRGTCRVCLKNDTIENHGLWDVKDQGALAVYIAYYLAQGNELKVGDKVEVPGMGEVKVEPNTVQGYDYEAEDSGIIVLPERIVFTKENTKDYDF